MGEVHNHGFSSCLYSFFPLLLTPCLSIPAPPLPSLIFPFPFLFPPFPIRFFPPSQLKLFSYSFQSCCAAVLRLRVPHITPTQLAAWFRAGPAGGRWRAVSAAARTARLCLRMIDALDLVGKMGGEEKGGGSGKKGWGDGVGVGEGTQVDTSAARGGEGGGEEREGGRRGKGEAGQAGRTGGSRGAYCVPATAPFSNSFGLTLHP